MDMVFRVVPFLANENLTRQSKRAIILGISHVLVLLVNFLFGISGLPELANFLLLTCLFELLSCPKVKACIRTVNGQETEREVEESESSSEPEEDEADCKKAKKLSDTDDVPTEAEFSTDEGEPLSEVEVPSGSEEELSTETDCKMSVASENLEQPEPVRIERPRWADYEDEDDDFLFAASGSDDNQDVSTSYQASDSEPEVNHSGTSDSEPEVNHEFWNASVATEKTHLKAYLPVQPRVVPPPERMTPEPERTLYKRSPDTPTNSEQVNRWMPSSPKNEWIQSSPKSEWKHSSPKSNSDWEQAASEQVIWKRGGSEADSGFETMLYKRGSKFDSDAGSKLDYDYSKPNSDAGSKLDYDYSEPDSKLDYSTSDRFLSSDPEDQAVSWKSPKSWSKSNSKTALTPNASFAKYTSPSSNILRYKKNESAKAADHMHHPWRKAK